MTLVRDSLRRRGLVRSRRGRLIGGVCAALGHWWGVSPWLVRFGAVLSVLIPGPQVLAYVILWILLPEE
ncbi:MAG: PspC domain-containing protein [Actinomycetota bacterium]|nr:PspC domain-containing protein [Actinomycetota bacterium]